MTSQIKTNNKRGNQYITTYCYPSLLATKIAEVDIKTQKDYCFITSYILCKVKETNNAYFNANISSKAFKSNIRNYSKYLRQLVEWNIININDNYSNIKGNSYCKTYSITKEAYNSGFITRNFKSNKPSVLTVTDNIKKNKIDINDPIINYTINSLSQLEVIDDIKPKQTSLICGAKLQGDIDDIISDICDIRRLDKFKYGNYRVNYGSKCNRLYNPIITMSRNARSHIFYKNSDEFHTYDIKATFPTMLFKFVDVREKDSYKQVLDGDIYDTIVLNTIYTRDQCKKAFNQFINGFTKNYVYDWFSINFPLTTEFLRINHKSMASTLQRIESDIMVNKLFKFLIDNNIPNVIGAHDGYFAPTNDNENIINNYIITGFKEAIGIDCVIKHRIKPKPASLICGAKLQGDTLPDQFYTKQDIDNMVIAASQQRKEYNNLKMEVESVRIDKVKAQRRYFAVKKSLEDNNVIDCKQNSLNRRRMECVIYKYKKLIEKIYEYETGLNN